MTLTLANDLDLGTTRLAFISYMSLVTKLVEVWEENANLSFLIKFVQMDIQTDGWTTVTQYVHDLLAPILGGPVVSMLDSWFWVLYPTEANLLSGVFSPLTSAETCEKSRHWLWKESCVSTGVRKPGNTDCHDMMFAVKMVLNPNTTNQLIFPCKGIKNSHIKKDSPWKKIFLVLG